MFYRVDAKSFVERWNWFADFPFDPGFLLLVLADPTAAVYADDVDAPHAAILAGEGAPFCFVDGDLRSSDAVLEALAELRAMRRDPSMLIVSACPNAWNDALRKLPSNWCIPRVDYKFNRLRFARHLVPNSYRVELLSQAHLGALAEGDFDFDVAHFHRTGGFGFVAIQEDRIVACAWSSSFAKWGEIAVGTMPKHRGRGLAKGLASRLIEECMLRDVTPHYTTDERNLAACAVANSLGFADPIAHGWVVLRCAGD